uniref:Uncharacterized protein n=1 Tax=Rhizophora mucronata TaxID=61149 RepID=A0A2P2IU85_RHIMU
MSRHLSLISPNSSKAGQTSPQSA